MIGFSNWSKKKVKNEYLEILVAPDEFTDTQVFFFFGQ
jgi:hypothetical protein